MRKTLIALAAASVLASGLATAANTTRHDFGSVGFVEVQHNDRYEWRDNRWDDRAQNINEREARIRTRIDRGHNTGRLTDFEARRLYRQLNIIEAKERTFMQDGRLNHREDAELRRNLDRLADNVRTQMRDDDRRYSYNNQYNNQYYRQ